MVRLAFAIDGFVDIWNLRDPYEVEACIASAMIAAVGSDVLIYRVAETQGAYFGLARLVSIAACATIGRLAVTFDEIRLFEGDLPYPTGVTMLTRLQLLDDAEFEAIITSGEPRSTWVAERLMRQEPYHLQIESTEGDAVPGSGDATPLRCAVTGERLARGTELTVISDADAAAGVHHDLLPLGPAARRAFLDGHLSVRDDLSILVDAARIDKELLNALNPTGRLILPDDPAFLPSPEHLARHRQSVFRLR